MALKGQQPAVIAKCNCISGDVLSYRVQCEVQHTCMTPWESLRRASRGNNIQPPHTKLVLWLKEKPMSKGRWYTRAA